MFCALTENTTGAGYCQQLHSMLCIPIQALPHDSVHNKIYLPVNLKKNDLTVALD